MAILGQRWFLVLKRIFNPDWVREASFPSGSSSPELALGIRALKTSKGPADQAAFENPVQGPSHELVASA